MSRSPARPHGRASSPAPARSVLRAAVAVALAAIGAALVAVPADASSHMDAPAITKDDAANTTDVYAFVSAKGGAQYLTTALAVQPFEEPGIGPNAYDFDPDVLYEIHVALGDDVAAGRPTVSYQFRFTTEFRNRGTLLQSYLGVIQSVGDAAQNRIQRYTVTRVDRRGRKAKTTVLGTGVVPPNNQGHATPRYQQGDDPEARARDGVADPALLDAYTSQSIATLANGHTAFAGQREDGFYGDIQAIFDLLKLRSGDATFDSQGGSNVHTMVLDIPLAELGGEMQVVGVYATTSRRQTTTRRGGRSPDRNAGRFVQVGRQGNPLFCEALVALEDKDAYNRSSPVEDRTLFRKYAETPELAALINLLVAGGTEIAIPTGRTDIAGIFIPDLIRVDLSTGPARLAGGGAAHPSNADDAGFSRLSVFGGDTLVSQVQPGLDGNGAIPGGWPNGRRFGDDVIDIAVSALLSDLRDPTDLKVVPADGIDNVNRNDAVYSKVFPYAGTPHNGRNHPHHGHDD